jgi:hypothetical protein
VRRVAEKGPPAALCTHLPRGLVSLLKNFLGGLFHPKSDTNRHQTRCFFSYWSPMCGRYQLNADFFNRLECSRKFIWLADSSV